MSQIEEKPKKHTNSKQITGILLLISGVVFLLVTYTPVISAYIKYLFTNKDNYPEVQLAQNTEQVNTQISNKTEIVFVNNDFGIYIPKIQTNARIIPDVDATNPQEYLTALKSGIAHAKGTSYPNQKGNVFLFAHSAVNFYDPHDYSVYFYLLGELKTGDEIYVSYKNQIYKYTVLETKIVSKTDTKYLGKYMEQDTLTLMTCWPSGTNLKRVIVTATRSTINQ